MCQGEYVAGHLWDIAPLVTDDTKTNDLKSFKTPLAATSDLKHTSTTTKTPKCTPLSPTNVTQKKNRCLYKVQRQMYDFIVLFGI